MKYLCPYCQVDMSNAHQAIVTSWEHGNDKDAMVLCVGCGEPIMIDHLHPRHGFRKPNFKEMEKMVEDPHYHAARAGFLHLQHLTSLGAKPPVDAMWHEFMDAFNLEGLPDDQKFRAKTIFMLAFSRAVSFMEEIYDDDDTGAARVKLVLAKAELNTFYEGLKGFDNDVKRHRKRSGKRS